MPVLLDQRAWTLGGSPGEWPRSRYSGAALHPGQMVVTIVVSWKELFGHAFIAFEWYADELPQPKILQRRHEVYEFVAQPNDAQMASGMTNAGCKAILSWRARPAMVVVNTDTHFFPFRDPHGRELPAYFRSWLVSFPEGWRARSAAVAAVASPPRYHYFELGGGMNCAGWVSGIAAMAGIEARHAFGRVVTLPKRLIPAVDRIYPESEMWEERKTRV